MNKIYIGLILLLLSLFFNGCASSSFENQKGEKVQVNVVLKKERFDKLNNFSQEEQNKIIESYTFGAKQMANKIIDNMKNKNYSFDEARKIVYKEYDFHGNGDSYMNWFNISTITTNANHNS